MTINTLYEAYKETHRKCMIMIRNWHTISQLRWHEHYTIEHMTIRPYVGICNNVIYPVTYDMNGTALFNSYKASIDMIAYNWSDMHNNGKHRGDDYFIAGRKEDRSTYFKNIRRLHFLIYLANEVHALMVKELNK